MKAVNSGGDSDLIPLGRLTGQNFNSGRFFSDNQVPGLRNVRRGRRRP
jgi:hypothetical protein